MISDNLKYLNVLPLEDLNIERNSFSCSSEPLENYFHKYVTQDIKKGLAKCFVLIDEKQAKIIGYYTLSALSVSIIDIPQERIKNIPYPNIPAVLVGRLAVDTNFQNQGYGKFLVADAIHRIKNNTTIGAAILVVEAIDDNAVSFYKWLGFIEFKELNKTKETNKRLFYPLTKFIK